MFTCEACHIMIYNLSAADTHLARSVGTCEVCKDYKVCVDCKGHPPKKNVGELMAGYDLVDHLLDYMIGMGFQKREIDRVLRALIVPELIEERYQRAEVRNLARRQPQ